MVWSVALANILGAGVCYAFSPQFARLATLRYTLILPAVLEHRLHRRVRGVAQLGRPVRAAALRRGRLADEAVQVAAAAAGARPRARRQRSSATCSSRSSATASPGCARPVVAVLLAMAIIGLVRPFLADVRRQGGIGKMLTSFQAPTIPAVATVHDVLHRADRRAGASTALPWAFSRQARADDRRHHRAAGRGHQPVQRNVPQARRGRRRQAWPTRRRHEVEQKIHMDLDLRHRASAAAHHRHARGAVLRLSARLHGARWR